VSNSFPDNLENLRPISGDVAERHDFVFAGGGLSGLSLAYHLAHSPLGDKSILIVDQSPKSQNDRTWGFWSDRHTPFEAIVDRSWSRLRFITPGLERVADLGAYRYKVIRGLDFYNFVRDDLAARENITFKRGRVRRIEDGSEEARVVIDDQTVGAKWVFDSCYGPADTHTDSSRYHRLSLHFAGWEIRTDEPAFDHRLSLHFAGWEIRTDEPAFDPDLATLMDFRVAQEGETRFFYLLPFDERRALVEYTIFSSAVLGRGDYEAALRGYIREQLGIEAYEIVRREKGNIPITDRPFPRKLGRRVMSIGARAGRIKPTTGYAFTRIQADSAAIVDSLLRVSHPFDVPADSYRYQLCDSILLDIMERRGGEVRPIFEAMFANNSIGRIFRFLDEAVSPWEHLSIIPTLPPRPFLRALLNRRVWPAVGQSHTTVSAGSPAIAE
jgi:lycopene beta-cyclase